MQAVKSIPLSAHELRDAVRHNQGFDASRLDRILRHEEGRGVIEVQASTPWRAVADYLRPGDKHAELASLRTTMRTIGESIARNAAGPDGRPAVAHVESITIITPDGELRRINRLAHGGLFAMVVGGHGLFGAIYSITLRVDSLARSVNDTAPEAPAPAAKPSLQLLLPPQAVERFLAEARSRCAEWRVDIENVELRDTLPEDETFLRWASRLYKEVGLRLAMLQTIGGAVRATQLRRELIDSAIAAGGSFPIARTPDATREQVAACYPQLPAFLAEKRRIDPAEKLVNGWYLHHRNLFCRERCETRWNQA